MTDTMQSSPPGSVLARSRSSPPRRDETQYSFDLDAFEHGSHSGRSSPVAHIRMERVLSENIDGPSDFTINMDRWMRESMRPKLATLSLFEPPQHGMTSLAKDSKPLSPISSRGLSHHTPERSPPRASLGNQPGDFQPKPLPRESPSEVAASLAPPAPTVEDYYSELVAPEQRPPHQPVGSHHGVVETSSDIDSPDIGQQLKDLRRRYEQLEYLNRSLTEALHEERKARKEDQARHAMQWDEANRRERDLIDMKQAAGRHMEAFRDEFAAQSLRLRETEQKYHDKVAAYDHLLEQGNSERRQLEADAKLHLSRKDDDMNDMQRQLDHARAESSEQVLPLKDSQEHRIVAMQELMDEVDRLKASHTAVLESIMIEFSALRKDHASRQDHVDAAATEQVAATDEANALRTALTEVESENETLRGNIDSLRSETSVLKQQLRDVESIDEKLNVKISQQMRKRDDYWRERLERLTRERKVMSKTLMHEWARTELGGDVPQLYEYKYHVRDRELDRSASTSR